MTSIRETYTRSFCQFVPGDQNHQQVATEFVIPHAQLELGHSVVSSLCRPFIEKNENYYLFFFAPGMCSVYVPRALLQWDGGSLRGSTNGMLLFYEYAFQCNSWKLGFEISASDCGIKMWAGERPVGRNGS